MSSSLVLVFAFLIGAVGGLRSLTAPAAVAWAAHLGWIHLQSTPLAFMGSTAAVAVLTLMALGELIADKLPTTPSRLSALGMGARISLGVLSGACLALAGAQSLWVGGILGALGGVVGAFAGYNARVRSVRALNVPDFVVALVEDAVAIGSSLWIVSRF